MAGPRAEHSVLVHVSIDIPWYSFVHLLMSELTPYSHGSFQSFCGAGLRAQEVLKPESTHTPLSTHMEESYR